MVMRRNQLDAPLVVPPSAWYRSKATLLCSDSSALCHSHSVFRRGSRSPSRSALCSMKSARMAVKCSLAAVIASQWRTFTPSISFMRSRARGLPVVDQAQLVEVRVVQAVQAAVRGLLADEALHLGAEALLLLRRQRLEAVAHRVDEELLAHRESSSTAR
jgi:hypothetical protein